MRIASAALVLLVLAGAAAVAASAPERDRTLFASLEALQREHAVPALGLVLVRDGVPVLIETAGTATRDTPLRFGSISKSFTALAALVLADEHGIDPDTPLDALLAADYYANRWEATHPVRLRQLLEQSAGFPDLRADEFESNEPLPLDAALARHADVRRTYWPPGWLHSYSNVSPGLTAAVIERVSGQSFESYVAGRVLRPLAMPHAGFLPVAELPGGYRADGVTEIPYWHMTFRAFGALNASVREMAGFLEALLNEGRLDGRQALPAAVVAAMWRQQASLGAAAGLEIGYAAGIYAWVRDGHVFWGHGGDADGYRSRYGLLPERGSGYLVVINADNAGLLSRMQRLVETHLLEGVPPPERPEIATDVALEPFTGSYYPAAARFGLDGWQAGAASPAEVEATGSGLRFERNGRRTLLYPVAPGRFRRPEDPRVSVVFVETGDGVLLMQGELGNYFNLTRGRCPAFLDLCREE